MNPQTGRAAFTLAIFVTVTSVLLLPFLERDSAEFVVTVLSIIAGGLTIVLFAILALGGWLGSLSFRGIAFGSAGVLFVELPPDRTDSVHAWHLYVLRLNLHTLSIDRARFFEEMRARGIGCSVHFIPIPLHPYYKRTLGMRDPCTHAVTEYSRLLSLPLYSKMTEDDVYKRLAYSARLLKAVYQATSK